MHVMFLHQCSIMNGCARNRIPSYIGALVSHIGGLQISQSPGQLQAERTAQNKVPRRIRIRRENRGLAYTTTALLTHTAACSQKGGDEAVIATQ